MIKDFELLKRNYAKLIVRRGLNVLPNRMIKIVTDDIDQPDFVNTLVEECYLAGAKSVKVLFYDSKITRTIYELTSLSELKKLYPFEKERIKFNIENDVSSIYLESNDPNYLKGIDHKKISIPDMIYRSYMDKIRGDKPYHAPYTIACVPSKAWAKFLFKNDKDEVAMEKLWKLIFSICHISKNDPIKAWDKYCEAIDKRAKWLNSLKIKTLHYKSKNGTNLTVAMTDKYRFAGAPDFDIKTKRKYYSNIPTEECFVSPHRLGTNGVVVASKPLVEDGQLIDGIRLTFKNGRIIKANAKQNEKLLKSLINAEENTHYLGEAALVPFSSPINKTGLIFFNTLYDENACCHFAFGASYFYTYQGYENMKKDELFKKGLNIATNHVDFMIGTKDLNITAITKDGKKVLIFKNGEWAK